MDHRHRSEGHVRTRSTRPGASPPDAIVLVLTASLVFRRTMKPLASASDEYRLEGAIALAWNVVLGAIVAGTAAHPLRVLAGFAVAATIFGVLMYVIVFRRYLRAALTQAQDISGPKRETPSETRRRVAVRAVSVNFVASAFVLLLLARGALLGIGAGSGVMFLVLARQIREWEAAHSVRVLREPRWRGRWNQGRLGRGVMDPQDFYLLRTDAGSRP